MPVVLAERRSITPPFKQIKGLMRESEDFEERPGLHVDVTFT